jgi:hypothetical protein
MSLTTLYRGFSKSRFHTGTGGVECRQRQFSACEVPVTLVWAETRGGRRIHEGPLHGEHDTLVWNSRIAVTSGYGGAFCVDFLGGEHALDTGSCGMPLSAAARSGGALLW